MMRVVWSGAPGPGENGLLVDEVIGLPNGSTAQNIRSPQGMRWMPPSTHSQPTSSARWYAASRSATAK